MGQRTFALVGNPNSGKTTLFNALTGLRQKVGNYPGVTVERKEGIAIGHHGEKLKIIDLPGAYSLDPTSPDEEILKSVLTGEQTDTPRPDAVICVVDASNAERHLYLATQILELGLPTIIVLNMTDVAANRNIRLDPEIMSERLGVPVVPMQANARVGVPELRIAMSSADLKPSNHKVPEPSDIHKLVEKASLDEGEEAGSGLEIEPSEEEQDIWAERLITARYESVQKLVDASVDRSESPSETSTDRIDSWLLHRFMGPLLLIGVLGFVFYTIFAWASIPMDAIDSLFGWLGETVRNVMPEGDFRDLITDGIIAGVGGVVIFLPQILILFFFIGLMEDTGYLSRVAFIMDRVMAKVGLNGRAFIPILSSYACAVPAIMGTRTIENPKDRLITIMIAPFASCSARLPVYLMMIAVMMPGVSAWGKVAMMLGLYLVGTIAIFVAAFVFNKVLRHGERTPMIMELPGYKAPNLKAVLMQMWTRSKIFLRRAGTVILAISILLWAAETYPKMPEGTDAEQQAQSFAGRIGKTIEPVIEPLGYDWRIGIGVVASFAAREVFVSAMQITFSVEEADDDDGTFENTRERLAGAVRDDGTPLFTPLVCLSLMMFYVFALQCASTVAITKRETNSWRWAAFQFGYMTLIAYIAALVVFQGGRLLGYS